MRFLLPRPADATKDASRRVVYIGDPYTEKLAVTFLDRKSISDFLQ